MLSLGRKSSGALWGVKIVSRFGLPEKKNYAFEEIGFHCRNTLMKGGLAVKCILRKMLDTLVFYELVAIFKERFNCFFKVFFALERVFLTCATVDLVSVDSQLF